MVFISAAKHPYNLLDFRPGPKPDKFYRRCSRTFLATLLHRYKEVTLALWVQRYIHIKGKTCLFKGLAAVLHGGYYYRQYYMVLHIAVRHCRQHCRCRKRSDLLRSAGCTLRTVLTTLTSTELGLLKPNTPTEGQVKVLKLIKA